MKAKLMSHLIIMVVAITFVFSLVTVNEGLYSSAKTKKYYLPKSVQVTYYEEDLYSSVKKAKYDKYGNLKSALYAETIPLKFKIKYRDKKGTIAKVSYTDGDVTSKKTYDKKGRIKKIVAGGETYKYKLDKKGMIKKVTCDGKTYYKVKSIKFHKNGFVSKAVYGNGRANYYNSDGLLTKIVEKDGTKYTYKYTKKSGKVVKAIVKCNGSKYMKATFKYGKTTTKDVWQYSCLMCNAGGPSNACELYAKGTLSGVNII